MKKIICLTPTKNEEWIIERFLKQASIWADHIVILDQGSTDRTVEIAKQFSKVIIVENINKEYDEYLRQKTLINKARSIDKNSVLIALDADEAIVGNAVSSNEWDVIKKLEPGTVIRFNWLNVLPSSGLFWEMGYKMPFGFVDDGREHSGKIIHNDRVPTNSDIVFYPKDIEILHFQYADWPRMESKHRWYQMFERMKDPKRSIISIYRQYHHMYNIDKKMQKIKNEWFSFYDDLGIDYKNFPKQGYYWWDFEVAKLINTKGAKFTSLDIWNFDWEKFSRETGMVVIIPKRSIIEKLILLYLKKTEKFFNNSYLFRGIDRIPRIFF